MGGSWKARPKGPPVTRRTVGRLSYALPEYMISEELGNDLRRFESFCTVPFYNQQEKRMAPVTARQYRTVCLRMLGWREFVRDKGITVNEGNIKPYYDDPSKAKKTKLRLKDLIPSDQRDGVRVTFDHLQWLSTMRETSPRTELFLVRAMTCLAKFLYHDQSLAQPSEGDKPYHDVLVIREMRKLSNDAADRSKVAEPTTHESAKWLSWTQYLDLVDQLEKETGLHPDPKMRIGRGTKIEGVRTETAVAWSLEIFLVFSILSCVPDRQRTIRELVFGRTLITVPYDGPPTVLGHFKHRYAIKHGSKDYKTGKDYGERPHLMLDPKITYYMDLWLSRYRGLLAKDHNFVFTAREGKPMSAQSVHRLFVSAAERITGQRTNPHLVRDMIVTYLRGTDASERELEALAIYMGHSVDMQRKSYDRRNKSEKVQPAVTLLANLNSRSRDKPSISSSSSSSSSSST